MPSDVDLVMSYKDRFNPDDLFIGRLIASYRAAQSAYNSRSGTIWGDIDERRRDIHDALNSESLDNVRNVLAHVEATNLYVGTDVLCSDFTNAYAVGDPWCKKNARSTYEHLLGAARALGAVPLPYPEDEARVEPAYTTDDLLDRIASVSSDAFDYSRHLHGALGIPSSRGVITWKTPMAIYQASRLRTLAEIVGGSRILEIGPGTGRAAMHYKQLCPSADYATIDLPLGIIAQAWFLGATLGPDAIWLFGDAEPPHPGQIRLLLAGQLESAPEDFDIIANVDSLTEMPRDQAEQYFSHAVAHAKVFFSINHEINPFRVRDLDAAKSVPVLRSVSTIRPGYAEEIFWLK